MIQVSKTSALKIAIALLRFIPLNASQFMLLLLAGFTLTSGLNAAPTWANPVDRTRSSSSLTAATEPTVAVPEVVRRTTVRILGKASAGSGVIIQKQLNTYIVLTCAHVVAEIQDSRYTILAADGLTYPVQRLHAAHLGNMDLALLKFTSPRPYQVADLGSSNTLEVGAIVYASGFPNWQPKGPNAIENTRDQGLKALALTVGRVGMKLTKPLQEGYQLGYTNEIQDGMSGGPVFSQQGKLVGINGRLKYPFQGISAFVFIDGTLPSEPLFQRMEALSWAIPVAAFQQLTQL